VAQVTRLRRFDDSVHAEFRTLRGLSLSEANRATMRRLADSATAQRQRILTPAQYSRYRYQVLQLRYPPRPPRGYR
jgi:hypothetical protein